MDAAFDPLKHLRAAQRPADNLLVIKREAPLQRTLTAVNGS